MSEHERIRELLPLAASGDISPEEMRRVREHLSRCETCRRERRLRRARRRASRPADTAAARRNSWHGCCELAELRLERKRALAQGAAVLAPLVAAGWIMALATWPLVRTAASCGYSPAGMCRAADSAPPWLSTPFLDLFWRASRHLPSAGARAQSGGHDEFLLGKITVDSTAGLDYRMSAVVLVVLPLAARAHATGSGNA